VYLTSKKCRILLLELWPFIADEGLHQKSNSLFLEAQNSSKDDHTASPEILCMHRVIDY